DAYRMIRFRKDAAPKLGRHYSVQLFHRGFLQRKRVDLFLQPRDGAPRRLGYASGQFDLGKPLEGKSFPPELGFAGFYSKDAIIESAFVAGQHNPVGMFAFIIGVIVAGLTAFYSWRLVFMTFHGHAKWGHDHHADDHGHAH
ncbi:glucan biosynthesis protein, partial [Proteus mirabilis]|uniref:glucan biosynthesis protein n=1 Tax=Proteus mirabilis TaxID=584 RepID=UPI001955006D